MKGLKLILAALLLFSTGVVAGVAGSRLRDKASARNALQKRGDLPPQLWQRMEFLRRIQKDLDLSPEQRQRIEGYVRESQENARRLWEPVAPQARAEMETLRLRIRGELTEPQRERFDNAVRERVRKGGKPSERGREGDHRRPGVSDPGPGNGR